MTYSWETVDGAPHMGHFSYAEMACHSGDDYPGMWIASRLTGLFAMLNVIRDSWGEPVQILSGYRTPSWNARVGGALRSQHVEGRAADIRPLPTQEPFSARVEHFYAVIVSLIDRGDLPELGGFGFYPERWVHVDTRSHDGAALAHWTGKSIGSEVT